MVRKEYAVIAILIALNIIIRYPAIPHELGFGGDSFFIHDLANSISEYGYAKWVIHPLSFFGLYPYSYASGAPHLLSISSLTTGIEMEGTIYIVSLLFGILGMFAAFVLAGEFSNNFYFKSLVAFIFSISPLAIKFTLWTVSARGLFLMMLPLFIWCLLRMHKKYSHKYLLLSVLFIISLASIHKMFVLIIPIMAGYLLAIYLPKITRKIDTKYFPYILSFLFIFLFLIQFLFIRNWWTQKYLFFLPFRGGEWYYYLIGTILTMSARLGFLIPLALFGLMFIIFKKKKSVNEWFLIITILLFTPLLGHTPYFYQTLLPFFSLLSGFGIIYAMDFLGKFIDGFKLQKHLVPFILILLVLFSLFTLSVRYTNKYESGYGNYMYESTYSLASFIQKETNNREITGDGIGRQQIAAFVTNPTPIGHSIEYFMHDLVDKESLKVKMKPLPRSLTEIHVFVKFPYATNTMNPKHMAQYVVETKNIKGDASYNDDNQVYDNGLEELWHASDAGEYR
jgi:hypothetical protein